MVIVARVWFADYDIKRELRRFAAEKRSSATARPLQFTRGAAVVFVEERPFEHRGTSFLRRLRDAKWKSTDRNGRVPLTFTSIYSRRLGDRPGGQDYSQPLQARSSSSSLIRKDHRVAVWYRGDVRERRPRAPAGHSR